ncbi:hypothetical protein K490DRAFT_55108 [Saccharata proteae CBS 121410]|uniref:Uncharacterized protein n=1 Tax=Saccharata proteae CBS 121410 TaxID=1314787 RepID=A0A6A5YFC5_9PEZI|nr:hypothetical protein K490DRAFT_55108 [Saccharata proteae CBS 121410]
MLRGLYHPLLVGLSVASVAATPGLFDVDWDKNPAPGAKNALRDKSYLPAQICGIIGAYICCVLVIGGLLLTVGRRMRRASQNRRVDLVKPDQANGFEMTPVSPSSTVRSRWWPQSPNKIKHAWKKSQSSVTNPDESPVSPDVGSVASFDQSVIKNDQEQRQREMERLYAAVMEHDDAKGGSKVVYSAADELDASNDEITPQQQQTPDSTPQKKSERRPLRLNTAATLPVPAAEPQLATPISPKTPRGQIRPLYPPESPLAAVRRSQYAPPPPPKDNLSSQRPASPHGILARNHTPSIGSSHSGPRNRRSIRNLRISAPMQRYPGEFDDDDARTPLTPRYYGNPPPPPSPPSQATTPATGDSLGPFRYEGLDVPQPLPRTSPQRTNSNHHRRGTPPSLDLPGGAALNPGITLQPPQQQQQQPQQQGSFKSAASSTSTLPLRSLHDNYAASPGPTKTTFLERKPKPLKDPLGRLRSPMTAGTPYSPYMPFTPITPVTPHLVTRKERKAREKEERKKGAVDEEDEVKGDDWGSGY